MSNRPEPLDVLVCGGGVAALETALALHHLAGARAAVTVIAPNTDFVYRPMTVREPFGFARAARYPLAAVLADASASLIVDKLAWVDAQAGLAHTEAGLAIAYDALVVAVGARAYPRYKHAVTIDDRRMDETLNGLVSDIETGYLDSIAFVAPARMAWPLPLYELALMTAGRASDMNVDLDVTIVTPEEAPLAIFGAEVSEGVARRLASAGIRTINSAYVEISAPGDISINPGDRRLRVRRVVALPELYGPSVRGLPASEYGFLGVDPHGRVPGVGAVYAAGDAVDFPIKHGGISAQMADAAAESIARLAGADIDPQPFKPVIQGVLLTDERPLYISAQITGGQGFSSRLSENPPEGSPNKISARYLAPRLERLDADRIPV